MNPVRIVGDEILFDGKAVVVRGRLSGKFIPYLAHNRLDLAERWIEHNQKLKINLLKVRGEGMEPIGDYADPPHFKPWPRRQMMVIHPDGKIGNRVRDNQVPYETIALMYELSHKTGIAFEYTIDATLKHIAGMSSGMIGHAISRTLEASRGIATLWPKAKVIFNFHDGYNVGVVKINEGKGALGLQAGRTRRWVRMVGKKKETLFSFSSPGQEWKQEQYVDAVIMVSEAGGTISYPVGNNVKEYPIAATKVAGLQVDYARVQRFRKPVWIDETEMARDDNLDRYLAFIDWADRERVHLIVTDQKGIFSDPRIEQTKLEAALGGGLVPAPKPEPEPEPEPGDEPEPGEMGWTTFTSGEVPGLDQEFRVQLRPKQR